MTANNSYSQSALELEQLTDSIQSILTKEHIPGVFVTVVSKDSILYKRGIGYVDIEKQIPVNSSHLFKIGSISKTFTALAIMKLVEEGKLSLDAKLVDIAPEVPFKNEWEASHPVRVKHLLDHKAGFDDIHVSMFTKDRTNNMTAFDEVLEIKHSLYSRWKPGSGFAYSNTGCTILGYIIEKITNQRYQEYIKNEILVPLNMNKTDFRSAFANDLSSDEFSVGYYFTGDTLEKSRDIKIICEPAGSLLSNADEMSNFLQFLLHNETLENHTVISSNSLKTMEALHGDLEIENNITDGYGLAIYTKNYGSKSIPFYGHGGDINGFSSLYIYNRELDLGIAISRNTQGSTKKIRKLLVNTFTKDVEKANNEGNIDGATLLDWEGDYKLLTTRSQFMNILEYPIRTVNIDINDDQLYLQRFLNDKKDVYVHQNGNSFTKKKHFIPSLHLIEKDGEKYVNYKNGIYEPVNSYSFLTFRILLGLSLVLSVIAMLTLVIHSIIALFKKTRRANLKRNLIVGLPMFSMLLPILIVVSILSCEHFETIGRFNLLTIFICFLTTIFPALTIWATHSIIKNWNDISNRFLKVYHGLIVFSAFFLSVYFIYQGWFMKMMWV